MSDFASLVSSSMMRPRKAGESFASVCFDPKVSHVNYKVYETKVGVSASSAALMSGELVDKLCEAGHSFVFPVSKGMVYFIVIEACVGGEVGHLTWLLDPFKRRQAAAVPAPDAQ